MSTHVVQIGKHKFVCGLFWQSLSRPRDLRREAVDLAKTINFNLMVLRKDHAVAQAGFAHTKEGAQRGLFSLAAAVSKTVAVEGVYYDGRQQQTHNWLGAFKLPDGMWAYFAVRDASFLPNGDFAGSKEEVLERLHGDYGLGGWNVVIGDAELEEYGFHNFNAKSIEELLPRRKDGKIQSHRWWALSPIERKLPWKPFVIGITALSVVGLAGFAYWRRYEYEKAQEELARAIEAAKKKVSGEAAIVEPPPHPWPLKPTPREFAEACVDNFNWLAPGGWVLNEYTCSVTQVTYSWSRGESRIEYLLQEVPQAVIELSGDKATYSKALQLPNSVDEPLLEAKSILMPLLSGFQHLGMSLKVSPAQAPAPSTLPGMKLTSASVIDWQTFTLSVSSGGVPPSALADTFSLPGVRLEKISYRAGQWSIEGVVYAK